MNLNKIELPTNRKFGFFFSSIFFIAFIFFYLKDNKISFFFISLAIIFFAITIFKSDLLLPLNKIWMRFGILMGVIISPIVLGIIFFGLFMPTAFVLKIINRDLLRLKFLSQSSYWIVRNKYFNSKDFNQQF